MTARTWALALFLSGFVASASGCGRTSRSERELGVAPAGREASSAAQPLRTLQPAAFGEALRALAPYADKGSSVLELRATAQRTVLQVRMGESQTVAEYVYDGRVLGPIPTHVAGNGELESNLFDLGEVDVEALARLFPTAQKAVDPADGRITELVIRRHLPFTSDVRVRLYVASPRLRGHLDADAHGQVVGTP